jgi:single-strand DNA-binding protein
MKSLNRVTLLGRLAGDVELHQTKNKSSLASFAVVTNRNSIDAEGVKVEIADFHRVVAFSKLADICSQYLFKGSAVLVEGKLVNKSFDNKDGVKQFRTEILLDYLNILPSSKKS